MTIFVLQGKPADNGKREVHRQEYRKQHDIVKNMINRAKIAHYSSLVEESSGNQKKNSLTLLKSCYISPKLQCFHLHTLIRTSQMHFHTFLLQKLRTSVVLSQQYLPFYHKHCHTRTHIVDSLCL